MTLKDIYAWVSENICMSIIFDSDLKQCFVVFVYNIYLFIKWSTAALHDAVNIYSIINKYA